MRTMMKNMMCLVFVVLLLPVVGLAQDAEKKTSDQTEPEAPSAYEGMKFAAIPIINYDPSFEWNFALMANGFFRS